MDSIFNPYEGNPSPVKKSNFGNKIVFSFVLIKYSVYKNLQTTFTQITINFSKRSRGHFEQVIRSLEMDSDWK